MKRNKKPNNKKKKRKQNKDIDVIYNVMVSEENDEFHCVLLIQFILFS